MLASDYNPESDEWKNKLRGEPIIVPKTEIDWKHEEVEFTSEVPGESSNASYGSPITRGTSRRFGRLLMHIGWAMKA